MEHVVKLEIPGVVDDRPTMRGVVRVEDGVPDARRSEEARQLKELEHVALGRRAAERVDEVASKAVHVVHQHLTHRVLELEPHEGVIYRKVLIERGAEGRRFVAVMPEMEETKEELGDVERFVHNHVGACYRRRAKLWRRHQLVLEPQAGFSLSQEEVGGKGRSPRVDQDVDVNLEPLPPVHSRRLADEYETSPRPLAV